MSDPFASGRESRAPADPQSTTKKRGERRRWGFRNKTALKRAILLVVGLLLLPLLPAAAPSLVAEELATPEPTRDSKPLPEATQNSPANNALTADAAPPSSAPAVFFEQVIRPVLVTECLQCHGPEKQEAELRLDSRHAMLEGGEQGPAVTPGSVDESLLISALRHEDLEMPPSGPLDRETISNFEKWVELGAIWPEQLRLRPAEKTITEHDLDWWSFRPLTRPSIPMVTRSTGSALHPIDAFVVTRLGDHQMQLAPQADRRTLVRRLYFNVIGLPPTPEEVESFVADRSTDAWPRLVDRLLDDPRYGEHWARFWLDIVRYAESDGWNQDAYRPQIYRYRDYVVEAFNDDKPFTDFVREQLAGDMLSDPDEDAWAATGYLRLGIYEYNQRNAKQHWDDIVNELTDVTGDVFFGMSVACARCHDHKFDPLLQRDYYRLRAYFDPVIWRDDVLAADASQREAYAESLRPWLEATQELRDEIDALKRPYHDKKWETTVDKFPLDIQACFHRPFSERSSWEEQMAYLVRRQFTDEGGGPLSKISKADRKRLDELEAKLAEFDSIKPKSPPKVMSVMQFAGHHSPTVIPGKEAEPIEPGRFELFRSLDASTRSQSSQANRLSLADWIVDPNNPVSLRVMVNRIWQQHFGQGLVSTGNDFGHSGALPSHPQLLDWLASEFVASGFRIKHLHRQILTSATWQQSTHHPLAAKYEMLDPAEELLWRAPVRRLSAEQIRDAMLFISGELHMELGGPSVAMKVPRRSLYVKRIRNNPERMLHSFDAANGLKSVAQRNQTTTPTQALLLLNGSFPIERAARFAERMLKPGVEDPVQAAFVAAWGRQGSAREVEMAQEFLGDKSNETPTPTPSLRSMTEFCHVLLNSNEFLYLD